MKKRDEMFQVVVFVVCMLACMCYITEKDNDSFTWYFLPLFNSLTCHRLMAFYFCF